MPDVSLNAVANLGYADCRFLKPVYPGDTLRAVSEVIGVKENSNGKTGVVWVQLEAPASPASPPEGLVFFRGKAAVILRGPAVLELAFPFHVERLPADPNNYWRDLRVPRVQF